MAKILIIDDDIAIVETLKILLSIKGYDTAAASDGQAGVDTALAFAPDLIILDLFLPIKDGAEVYSELRSNPSTASTPVLFLSSFAEKPEMLSRPDQHIPEDHFFPKPVDPTLLLDKIASLIT